MAIHARGGLNAFCTVWWRVRPRQTRNLKFFVKGWIHGAQQFSGGFFVVKLLKNRPGTGNVSRGFLDFVCRPPAAALCRGAWRGPEDQHRIIGWIPRIVIQERTRSCAR